MAILEVQRGSSTATYLTRVKATPAGQIELELVSPVETATYGPVEIAWYPDRLVVTARGAGHASIIETNVCGEAEQDVLVEIRLPGLDELTETVPGAD